MPRLKDPVISQRWRGYLEGLREWLAALMESASTPEEVDRLLFSEDLQPFFRRLLVEIPEGYLDATQELASRTMDVTYAPATPELRAAMEAIFENPARYYGIRNEATEEALDWFRQLPLWVTRSQAMRVVRWAWFKQRPGVGKSMGQGAIPSGGLAQTLGVLRSEVALDLNAAQWRRLEEVQVQLEEMRKD
jgi:hypothetical protein